MNMLKNIYDEIDNEDSIDRLQRIIQYCKYRIQEIENEGADLE